MSLKPVNITLGTAGHIDHGKTALIKCLTGCETDRLKEEKERGMSIELGYAPCEVGGLRVGIVDVPGHENFIRTMVAGASGMDGCILVVAADDGPMPQTREHLDILTLLQVRAGIVALTKIDRVLPEELEVTRDVLAEFLRGTFLESAPVLPVSNITGEGFGAFYDALAALVASIPPRPVEGVFRLPVERAFSAHGYGTVIAGVPTCGSARIDDELVLLPQGETGRIKALQVYGHETDRVLAGECAAVNIRHFDHKRIGRGDVLTLPGYFEPREWCIAELRLLPQDKLFLKNGTRVKFHTGTSERLGKVHLMQGDGLAAGQAALVQIHFDTPLVAGPRDRFIIRSLSPVRTIGGGMIVELAEHRLNRNRPEVQTDFAQRAQAVHNDTTFAEYIIRAADGGAISETALATRIKLLPAQMTAILNDLIEQGCIIRGHAGLLMHAEVTARCESELLQRVADFHRQSPESPGPLIDELRQRLSATKDAFDLVLGRLQQQGKLTEQAGRVALPGHASVFAGEDAAHAEQIESLFRERLFTPPNSEEIVDALQLPLDRVQRFLRTLREQGRLVRIEEGLLFHREAVARARAILVDHIRRQGGLESVKFKYLLDTSRKFAIPLLDYFDRIGLTRQVNHTRYLRAPIQET